MAGANPGDDGASSSVIAFMVAGVLFMASVVAVLVTTNNGSDSDSTGGEAAQNARFAIQSSSLAEILLESPGYYQSGGVTSPLDWSNDADYNGKTNNADNLARLGLLDPDSAQPFMMDYAKFQNLRRAGFYANPSNGYVDYEEASETLGLADSGLDFHLRAYPTLESVADLLRPPASKDTNLRVTYIGDIEVSTSTGPASSLTDNLEMTAPVCTLDPTNPFVYLLTSRVTNGGSVATQFTVATEIELTAKEQRQNANSYLVQPASAAPNNFVDLVVEVPAVAGRACAGDAEAEFDLYDPIHAKLMSVASYGPAECNGTTKPCMGTPGTATTTAIGLQIDTAKQNYRPTEAIVLNYDGNGLTNNDELFLRVCAGTAECTAAPDLKFTWPASGDTFPAEANSNSRKVTIPAGTLPVDAAGVGEYTAWLYDCESDADHCSGGPDASNLHVTERILVTSSAIEGYSASGTSGPTVYTAPAGPAMEVQFLESLISKFCPTWFDSTTSSPLTGVVWADRCDSAAVDHFKTVPAGQTQPGDVFPDSKKVMNEDLPARLLKADGVTPNYDITNVLVVGSGVDHNAMTSQAAKGTIETWVHGGGTIIVFGSDEGNVNWLEPLFHSAIAGSGGAISTPDQGHPMLHTPNELDNPAQNYDAHETAWRFNGQTALAQNSNDPVFSNVIVVDDTDPLLALSNKGSFGSGSIIITAYMPWDLYGDPAVGGQLLDETCSGPYTGVGTSRTRGDCEGMHFMHNLLMQGYADLYLDYGPEIPGETDVTPAQRTAQIEHPQLGNVVLTIIVYVF